MPAESSRHLARRADAEREALAARLIVLLAPEPPAPETDPDEAQPQRASGLPVRKLALAVGAGLVAVWWWRRRS